MTPSIDLRLYHFLRSKFYVLNRLSALRRVFAGPPAPHRKSRQAPVRPYLYPRVSSGFKFQECTWRRFAYSMVFARDHRLHISFYVSFGLSCRPFYSFYALFSTISISISCSYVVVSAYSPFLLGWVLSRTRKKTCALVLSVASIIALWLA